VDEAKREYELANTLPTQSASLPSIELPGPVVVLYYERLITLQEATLSDFLDFLVSVLLISFMLAQQTPLNVVVPCIEH
jgi:hypothetical protein